MTTEPDYRWIIERMMRTERELGESDARQSATEAAVSRVASEMKDGFRDLKDAQITTVNALRGEMKSADEQRAQQRKTDMQNISDALNELRQDKLEFRRSLSKVAWVIIAAIAAATAGQLALNPQVRSDAVRGALQVAPQLLPGQ